MMADLRRVAEISWLRPAKSMEWALSARRRQRGERWRSRRVAGGEVYGAVLAGDLHLEDDIGLLPGGGAGVGEKSDKPALEGSEAALDLALGLG